MPPPDPEEPTQARLEAISEALARMVRRQEAMEARLERIESALQIRAEPEEPVLPPPLPASPPTPPPLPEIPVVREAPVRENPALETRFGLNWLNRVAIVTLIFGAAFFFKYAVDNQWIGPGSRIALGIVAAALSLVIGELQSIRGQKIFAQGMTGLGLALFYLSFYATFGFYHVLPQGAAFALMALTTVGAGVLAYHYGSLAVAALGLIGGYLTPVLLSTGENRIWTLIAYTLLLNIGALVLGHIRRMAVLAYLALAGTLLLYAGWSAEWLSDDTRWAAFTWLSSTFLLMFVWSVWTDRRSALWLLPLNSAAYFANSYSLLHNPFREYMGAFTAALAVLHAAAFKLALSRDTRKLTAAIAVAFLTLAIPIQFTGFSVTIAWALEAAAIGWLASRLQDWRIEAGAGLLFLFVLIRLFSRDAWIYSGTFYPLVMNLRVLTFCVSAASLWIYSRIARFKPGSTVAYVAGHIVLISVMGLEVSGWAQRSSAPAEVGSTESIAISILTAIYAFILISIGAMARRALDRFMGLALLGIVIAKLYVLDVWELSRGFRITAFLALGGLLLLVSYLYSRFKPAIERFWRDRPAEP